MATTTDLDATEQPIWTRQRNGTFDLKDVVHHTDRGSQAGFHRSSAVGKGPGTDTGIDTITTPCRGESSLRLGVGMDLRSKLR
jgi:hypothetical protein